jgi:iron complex transport system substrate-binding protein
VRIVSLSPAATAIVRALGLDDELVGLAADDAGAGDDIAVVAAATRDPEIADDRPGAGPTVHARAALHAAAGAAGIVPDAAAIAALDPDLVLVQAGCPACAVRFAPVDGLRAALGTGPSVVSLEPVTLEGIFNAIATVGAMTEAEDEAIGLVEMLRERLASIGERVLRRRDAGRAAARVVALEWLDPPMTSGHWLPSMIRDAGGWDLLGRDGGRPVAVDWEAIRDVDPEVILLAPHGSARDAVVRAWRTTPRPAFVDGLRAVANGSVIALDAAAAFGLPGPHLVDGVAALAEILDPDGLAGIGSPDAWVPVA